MASFHRPLVHARRAAVAATAAAVLVFPSTAAADTVVIRVVSVTTSGKYTDAKPKGPSKGDRIVLTSRLFNAAKQFDKTSGAQVGSDKGTLTFRTHTSILIDGTATLPGGTIHFRGKGTYGGAAPIPVVGGTGRYAGARGTLTIGTGDTPLNTYRLTLPLVA